MEPTDKIYMHFRRLFIDNSTQTVSVVGGANIAWTGSQFDIDREQYITTLERSLNIGEKVVISVSFAAPLARSFRGIYWSSYLENNITK
jgi:hypothetical protein